MLPPALEKQRHRLYAQTVDAMSERLGAAAGDEGAVFSALRWGMKEMDDTFAETPARVRAAVACRAGCAHCCSVPVEVQAHEVFFAADHIQVNFSPVDLAAVLARTADHRGKVAVLPSAARASRRQPCALLRDDRCSIYAGRPAACRAHHTSDAAVCAADAAGQPTDLEKVYLPALRSRLFAVMLGLDAAVEAAGFDDRAYDFGSALNEALTNSLCRIRWLRGQPAFPASCLAV